MKIEINNNRFLSLIIGLVLAVFLTSCSKDTVGGEETDRKPLPEEPTKDVNSYFDKIKDENNLEGNFEFAQRLYFDENKRLTTEPDFHLLRKVTFSTNASFDEVQYNMDFFSKTKIGDGSTNISAFSFNIFRNFLTKPSVWNVSTEEEYGLRIRIKGISNTESGILALVSNKFNHDLTFKQRDYMTFNQKVTHLYLYKTTLPIDLTKSNEKQNLYILLVNPTKYDISKIEKYKDGMYRRGDFVRKDGIFSRFLLFSDVNWR